MTLTAERPPVDTPDGGVIEEARARQHRQRAGVAAVTLASGVIAALVLGFAGGGGGSGAGRAPSPGGLPGGRTPSKTARLSPPSCASGKALQGAPSGSLLSILGVLRRPAIAGDALPSDVRSNLIGTGFVRDVFVRYIRRTRVIGASSYYIYPAIVGECGTREAPHEGIMDRETNVDLGHGLIGGTGGGGGSAADIEQGRTVGSGPPESAASTTITMIVPDGVASVTLHFPAGRASGYSPKISPPVTISGRPVGNELVLRIPRSNIPESVPGLRMIWRAANGHVIRRFRRL